ncbi:flavin reductase family protein [Streptomyces sp. NBC_01077]|uniref:flavin reductase family protein n=1 Tax=Streptomyces sp. NBC_01077 TaxID=2903746 RepID=UPI00386E6B3F|nr:flavin reductase family protein [Streptomyces sp. NBC_01077]
MSVRADIRAVRDTDTFKDALSLLASPLTLVTTADGEGRRWGLTASSVTSASLSPPLVMVGIAHTSSCAAAFATASAFVVNVLGEQHQELARRFATRGIDRFAGQALATWPGSGLPFVPDAHAAFRCEVADRLRVGDHEMLVGRPTEVLLDGGTRPLLWHGRAFRTTTS